MSMPRKIRCTVEALTDHGGRVYTVDLRPDKPLPSFKPGQFLHLTVDEFDPSSFWPESRVFSIASSPRDRQRVRICYSGVGRYTRKMEQALAVGRGVWIKLPYGEFIIDSSTDAVLLAGGTGISAFTAFLEALAPDHPQPVWLVYGARNPDLLLFRDKILAQLERVPNFRVLFFVETTEPGWAPPASERPNAPEYLIGRISLDEVWPRITDPTAKVFYLSGPPPMLNALTTELQAREVPPDRIRMDAWE